MHTQSLSFDYVIIGAGPAGCALAARLAASAAKPSVALLEAGSARPSALSRIPLGIAALVPWRSRLNYAFHTTPQVGLLGRKGFQPRGRGPGGSSLINAMIYTRGQKQDYDAWAAMGCDGWSYEDVLPYFRKSESNSRGATIHHGADGPLKVADLAYANPAREAFIAAAMQAGFPFNDDFNAERQEGVGPYQVFQHEGRRLNAAEAYLGETPPDNLALFTDCRAERLIFETRRAIAVLCKRSGDILRFNAHAEIILAAGAFATPQLLMLSGLGPAAHLRSMDVNVVHDAPDVGSNLQDHIDVTLNERARGEGLFGVSLRALMAAPAQWRDYTQRGTGLLTSNAAEAGGFIKSTPELARPDLQLHFCIGLVDRHNRRPRLGDGLSLHVCVLRPKSRGVVRLAGKGAATPPLIDPRFLSEPDDMALMKRGVTIARDILRQPALRAYGGRPLHCVTTEDETALETFIRRRADTIYHPAGTCRMGADSASVVDPALNVRGVSGLRIADASIMPTLISGNTQAPCAMIGEKAADLILSHK